MSNLLINQIFIKCSSHTICGIKPANLFTVPLNQFSETEFNNWKIIINNLGLSVCSFKSQQDTMMFFVYDKNWIKRILNHKNVNQYLNKKGYSENFCAEEYLQELFNRLCSSSEFPHEVGIFLGYPIEDVIYFEKNQGSRCKYCGYWKSYCNPEQAKKYCRLFKECTQMCTKWFEEGYSVPQIIRKYKKAAKEAA